MKKTFIALMLLLSASCGYAQEHLSFKGIPIEGSLNAFCQKLKSKGFVETDILDSNTRLFKGPFTGRQVTVGIAATDDGQDVFSVIVFLPKSDEWNNLVSTYRNFKDLYTEKYGNPTTCEENTPSTYNSNSTNMYDLSQGRVSYYCVFKVSGGVIRISIENAWRNKGQVTISYLDEQNADAKRQRDLDDI